MEKDGTYQLRNKAIRLPFKISGLRITARKLIGRANDKGSAALLFIKHHPFLIINSFLFLVLGVVWGLIIYSYFFPPEYEFDYSKVEDAGKLEIDTGNPERKTLDYYKENIDYNNIFYSTTTPAQPVIEKSTVSSKRLLNKLTLNGITFGENAVAIFSVSGIKDMVHCKTGDEVLIFTVEKIEQSKVILNDGTNLFEITL